MKKTKEELQNELAEAQRQYDQEQHRQQRLQNRKEYFETTVRRQRNHRLITRGAAMESVFPEVKPLTEREFYELAERAVGEHQEFFLSVHQAYQKQYETHNAVKTRAYDGIPELLETLTARGIRICVLSNKPHADTLTVVSHYFPSVRFDAVQGQIEGIPVKPDPTGALMLADRLGIKPDDFAYLGDTSVDMQCAVKAGMHPYGVLWGFRKADELLTSGAEALLSTPSQLLNFL